MTVALVFPPVVDPRAPHLALPSLAAYLRANQINVNLFDLNISGLRYLLQTERLRRAAEKLRQRQSGRWDLTTPESKLALYADSVVERIEWSLDTLTDTPRFFDGYDLASARELVSAALAISATACHSGLSYAIMPPQYDVQGVDPANLAQLIKLCTSDQYNLFAEHWRDSFFPELEKLNPQLVGISITNRQQIIPGLTLAYQLRQRGFFTVLGGTVYTKFANELPRLPAFFGNFADAVVVYEGETTLLKLVQQLNENGDLSAVPNLLYLRDGKVVATDTHVENINELPPPDFSGLDLGAYLAPHPVLPVLTGKGCYYNRCKFCDIPHINHISKKAYRVRTPEHIAADIVNLVERFNCRHFLITDEALSPRLLVKLADALHNCKYKDLSFTGYARLEAGFTPEVCATLHNMGIKKLYFGLESADQTTQDHMDKGTDVNIAPVVLKNCADAGINFHLFSIIGFPQESESSARTTFQFFLDNQHLIEHPGNSFDIHPFGLDLRTDYFRDCEQYDIIIDPVATRKEFVISIDRNQWSNPSSLDAEQVQDLLKNEFYPQLRKTYRRFHATAEPPWPGFEEYAVLYGRHYDSAVFPFQTSIPRLLAGEQLDLAWRRSVAVMEHADAVLLLQRHTFLRLPKKIYDFLNGRSVYDSNQELVAELACAMGERVVSEAEVTAYLDALIGQGYLQVALFETESSTVVD